MCPGIFLGLNIQVTFAFDPSVRQNKPWITLKSTPGLLCLSFQEWWSFLWDLGLPKLARSIPTVFSPLLMLHCLCIILVLLVGGRLWWGKMDSSLQESNHALPSPLKTYCHPSFKNFIGFQAFSYILSAAGHYPRCVLQSYWHFLFPEKFPANILFFKSQIWFWLRKENYNCF